MIFAFKHCRVYFNQIKCSSLGFNIQSLKVPPEEQTRKTRFDKLNLLFKGFLDSTIVLGLMLKWGQQRVCKMTW